MSDKEIVSTRLLRYPRTVVFRAWTDPHYLALWWGPKGFRNSFSEFDLRPGGYWRFIMQSPDGTDYRNESIFVEIVPPERIVFDHISGHRFRVTATFKENGPSTFLHWSMLFETADECEISRSAVVSGNEQNLDRLESVLPSING